MPPGGSPNDRGPAAREALRIGRAIAARRAEVSLSARELAERSNLEPARVDAIEAGAADTLLAEIVEIAHALSLHPSELYARAEELGEQ